MHKISIFFPSRQVLSKYLVNDCKKPKEKLKFKNGNDNKDDDEREDANDDKYGVDSRKRKVSKEKHAK